MSKFRLGRFRRNIPAFLGSLLLFASLTCALHPNLREYLHDAISPAQRKVVSTVTGDLLGNGTRLKVVKLKTPTGISIEIYDEAETNGQAAMIEHVDLENMHDAYFNFNGEATQLALQDVDGDRHMEILVPSFDADLVAHLSVFKLEADSHKLRVVSN